MLVSLHQGLFSYCGKIRDSCSVFRGVRLLQTVSLITAGGSAAFSISAARGVIRTAATWVIVWVFHITLIVGSNVFHHLAVAVVTGNLDGGFLQLALDVNAWGEDYTAVGKSCWVAGTSRRGIVGHSTFRDWALGRNRMVPNPAKWLPV